MSAAPTVLVSLVTFNSSPWLRQCLESVKRQNYPSMSVCAWDNASRDDTPDILASFADFLTVTRFSARNLGFSAAHNRLLSENPSDYVLVLNPDIVLEAGFVQALVGALEGDPSAGSATGKLWRWESGDPGDAGIGAARTSGKVLDTTGMYFTPSQRHLDRGSGETDRGQYETREYVFGPSGAAAFYRRRMLEEARSCREYFDEDFFAYREDADLAWRAQWLGWRCLYVPEARGYHVRRVLPQRRASLPPEINMHSLKNRFLMRVKNMDAGTYFRFFLPITVRDAAAFAYVLARERYSLRAVPLFFRALPRAWTARRALRRHRRVSPRAMRAWFSHRPVSLPLSNARIAAGSRNL